MRKATALTIAACLLLCGCSSTNGVVRDEDAPKPNVNQRFICDYNDSGFETVVDSQTGVTYLVWKGGSGPSSRGGITVLLDRDGKPIISEEVAE